ncbi:DNA polymerase III subunit delta' [Atopomonas sediminilitoris]|uniref:DNA polymerase III subunit delta' n=1 Tax=Atopomonas sediminilitoris TaxID=2919919 RepID=UPI001F4DA782|nr:DNA polymerase III subunit delta' [Atopomonas sediminilitoris]MCJ8167784.1 DNA polymerase III subunit delta' [Atopomonas sediminilitoris]
MMYPWQQQVWQQLSQRQQHAHAYLFKGQGGIGKRELAEAFVGLLLCQSPQQYQACEQCKACLLRKAGTHPDLQRVMPEEPDKPIKIDQVRALVDFVAQTAQLGGRKVVLLAPAEAMNTNAANALLKSLEEPSGNTVLVLLSDAPSRLLPTVRSRCQQLQCPCPSPEQSLAWLKEQRPEADTMLIAQALHWVGGSPLQALSLLSDEGVAQRATVVDAVKALLKGQQTASQVAESWNKLDLLRVFDWFFAWTQALLRQQLAGQADEQLEPDMHKVLGYLAQRSDSADVLAVQQWLLQQRQKVLGKANLNRVLLLEALLLQWASLAAKG